MSSTWKMGERVRVVRPTGYLKAGQIVTVEGFECVDGVAYVDIGDGTGSNWDLSRFEKVEPEDTDDVEPEPLKAGDWTLVWGQVDTVRSTGRVALMFEADDGIFDFADASPDAIVRPNAGQVPPWVKPARCTSLKRTVGNRAALWQCARDEHTDDSHECGDVEWTNADEYGHVEVSS